MNTTFRPDWDNLDLGAVPNQRFVVRILLVLRAAIILAWHRRFLTQSDVWIARNFDLLALAWFARTFLMGKWCPLVYECLDIHGLFTGSGRIKGFMRWLERRLLARVQLTWVSSPGFVEHYFRAVQNHDGPYALLENKLWFEGNDLSRPRISDRRNPATPLRIGWVGSIRCQASLDILLQTARTLGPKVEIAIHGNIHHHAFEDFDDQISRCPNVTYNGRYSYPDGLLDIYCGCDVVWAQDLWQRGSNSDWLLPNRIYEASWFGCPSIAVGDTETGRRIKQDGLGYVINAPSADDLVRLTSSLSPAQLRGTSARMLSLPDHMFRMSYADLADALAPVLSMVARGGPPQPESSANAKA